MTSDQSRRSASRSAFESAIAPSLLALAVGLASVCTTTQGCAPHVGYQEGSSTITEPPESSAGKADGGSAGSDPAGGAGAGGDAAVARPNILLIIADDFGAEASSLYPQLNGRSGAVSTPNLEALAAEGLVFDNAWANPVCTPTRSTIVSGLYGHHTGVTYVGDALPTSTTTLFDRISTEAEYDAALFGKYHLGGTVEQVRELGIPTFRGFLGGGLGNYYKWTVRELDASFKTTTTYATTAITDFAIEHIRDVKAHHAGQPWFIYQAYNAPHFPHQVPPRELHSVELGTLTAGTESATLANYKAMIQSLDTELGRLLSEIDLDDTTVIFIGDNGTEQAMKDVGSGVRGSKASVFEGGVRIPFIIAGAGVTRRGREPALVSTVDLYATVLSLAGLPVSRVNDSYSITPLLTDAHASSGRAHAFAEACLENSRNLYAIRDARFKLISANGRYSLYDLLNDPLETTNLYNDTTYAAQRASLLDEVATLKATATGGCFQ